MDNNNQNQDHRTETSPEIEEQIQKFDVIVVGGGFAGVTAAIKCAKEGLSTALFDRGDEPSGQCTMPAVLYSNIISELVPEFVEEGAVDRFISSRQIRLFSGESTLTFDLQPAEWKRIPHNNLWTMNYLKFDHWYLDQAKKAGVEVFLETHVEYLLTERKHVYGIETEDGRRYHSNIVIIASGSNTPLVRQAGLQVPYKKGSYILGIREIIQLDKETIDSRFNLKGNEGAVINIYGDLMRGHHGSGMIVTGKDSVSISAAIIIKDLKSKSRNAVYDILLDIREHPTIKRLIEGGKSKGIFLHLGLETGFDYSYRPYADGVMVTGDAAGFINAKIYNQGTLFATVSGYHAAEAAVEAIRAGNCSEIFLSIYSEKIDMSYAFRNVKFHHRSPFFAENMNDFFDVYPKMVVDTATDYYTNDDHSRDNRQKKIFTILQDEMMTFPFPHDLRYKGGFLGSKLR